MTPVGSATPVATSVRVLAATNSALDRAVDEGRFRGDVYARLAEITIRTPWLSERREDLLPLLRVGYGSELPPLTPSLVEALLLHDWRFNVRELFKVAKELKIRGGDGQALDVRLVEHRLGTGASTEGDAVPPGGGEPSRPARPRTANPPSRAALEAMLRECRGNLSRLARLLGRSRRQVYRYLDSCGLDVEDFRE